MEQTTTSPKASARRGGPAGGDAFTDLYRDSRDDVYSYLAYLVSDRSLAEELTADAFEHAYRKRDRFDAKRGDLRAWLFRVARNLAIDELRRRQRVTTLEFPVDELVQVDMSDQRDDRLIVAEVMRSLQTRDRDLVALKFFAGLTNAEIAKVLRRSPASVGTNLHRAITKIRDEFEIEGDGNV